MEYGCRRELLRLEAGSAGEYILEPGKHIMEVKITNATPVWFVKLLTKHQIVGSSFSKYGTFYKEHVMLMKQKKQSKSNSYKGLNIESIERKQEVGTCYA